MVGIVCVKGGVELGGWVVDCLDLSVWMFVVF